MPGGFGNLWMKFFEDTYTCSNKNNSWLPHCALRNCEYSGPLMEYIEFMAKEGTISPEDLKLVLVTDDMDEAINHIKTYVTGNYKIKKRKRIWWLFEKI
jgi:predicted Rossmann-fold nucleotide-binding protein